MICSMTGFAREAGTIDGAGFVWELKSVNGRTLDLRVRVPPGYDAIGEEARKATSAAVARGTVNLTLTVQRSEAGRALPRINTEALAAAHKDALEAARMLSLPAPGLETLLQLRGVVDVAEAEIGPTPEFAAALVKAGARAAAALAAARRNEGEALRSVIHGQLDRMEALVRSVASHPARTPEAIKARLEQQVSALLESAGQLDQGRLYQEAALIATRADVREELDRLDAHIAATRTLLQEGGAVGRKLDFLAQEFGREASTLCAKANHVELSRFGLELRTVVDQFREQVQNVE